MTRNVFTGSSGEITQKKPNLSPPGKAEMI